MGIKTVYKFEGALPGEVDLDKKEIRVCLPVLWRIAGSGDFESFVDAFVRNWVHEYLHIVLSEESEELGFSEKTVMTLEEWLIGEEPEEKMDEEEKYSLLLKYLEELGGSGAPAKVVACILSCGPSKRKVAKITGLSKKEIDVCWERLVRNGYIKRTKEGLKIEIEDFDFVSLCLMVLVAEGFVLRESSES